MTVACSNTAAITFPKCTGGSETATHFGIGTASSGAGVLLFFKTLNSNINISNNIQPTIPIGDLDVTVTGDVADTWVSRILNLLFVNADAANIGDATGLRGSSAAGSLYVSLHTGTPAVTGTQATNECAYTSYARVAVARTAGGWTIA